MQCLYTINASLEKVQRCLLDRTDKSSLLIDKKMHLKIYVFS